MASSVASPISLYAFSASANRARKSLRLPSSFSVALVACSLALVRMFNCVVSAAACLAFSASTTFNELKSLTSNSEASAASNSAFSFFAREEPMPPTLFANSSAAFSNWMNSPASLLLLSSIPSIMPSYAFSMRVNCPNASLIGVSSLKSKKVPNPIFI